MSARRPSDAPPEAWVPARALALRLMRPLERFLHVEAASGVVLLLSAALALAWANSPWAASYERLWHTPVTLGLGEHVLRKDLHFWINDGLMTIFFFVVGLEIRRELHEGELADLRRAVLPIAAALGGMLVPALIYLALNRSPPERHGWGVPMATDIAFAVGVLALLGRRVPAALRVLLLALAIIDDIGAIVVIAVFYSSGIAPAGFAAVAAGLCAVIILQRLGVRTPAAYIAPGAVTWAGMLQVGVHPAIAGVLLGLLTPARTWFGEGRFLEVARSAIDDFEQRAGDGGGLRALVGPLSRLKQARREALPPVVRLETALHPWVAYGIMPLFALANAGVRLDGVQLGDRGALQVLAGVALGLVLGKPLGIALACALAVNLRVAALPRGVTWRGIAVVGCVGGIGFTMAIFVAGLAYASASSLAVAKLGVLLGSAAAAILAMLAGRILLPLSREEEAEPLEETAPAGSSAE